MESKPVLTVLDDDEAICLLIGEVASDMNYEVRTFTSVKAFKEEIDHNMEILFLDLMMPDEDGIEVIRYLEKIKLKAKLILMSGFDKRVLKSASIMAKTQGITVATELNKPFSIKHLRKTISQCESPAAIRIMAGKELSAQEIEQAISEDRVFVQYQPKIDLSNNQVFGAEALVRIRDAEGNIVPPGLFIAVAEKSGAIVEITREVIRQSIAFCSRLKALGYDLNIAINMPAKLLGDVSMTDDLVMKINTAKLRTDNFTIEITESALVENYAVSLDVLTRLRMKGVYLSIDDFGTGYSTMQQLKNVPFTEMKLDQSFVMDIFEQDAGIIISKSIELSHELGMHVLAEGVETLDVANELIAQGCDYCQGYYYSRPVNPDDFVDYLTAHAHL
ncbi:MAG: EAL domain-containing response regulator [Gammaproteobacteria bacterium]|nr:EAL domain-containing response regulator [Gammaproteobacteria bacterium]